MLSRLNKPWTWVRRRAAGAGATVVKFIGPGELWLTAGLVMVGVALWPFLGQLTLLPIGLVFIWIGMPTRHVFVLRTPVRNKKQPRRAV